MSKDSLLVVFVLVALIGVGVGFFVINSGNDGEADFAPADTSMVDEIDQIDDRTARRATVEAPPPEVVTPRTEGPAVTQERIDAPDAGDAAIVSGAVVDPLGRPVPQAAVTLCIDVSDLTHTSLQGEVYASTLTDTSGKFELVGVSVEDGFLMRVDHDAYASEFVPKIKLEAGERRVLNVQLSNGQVLTGNVTDIQGTPIQGVDIMVFDQVNRSMDPTQDVERIAVTDINGDFEFSNLNPGYKRVTAFKAGYGSVTNPAVQVQTGKENEALSFQLAEGSHIVGVITEGDDGPPVEGVIVTAQPIRRSDRNVPVANYPSVKTDQDGRFDYQGLAPGTYALVCHKRGYGTGRRMTAKTGDDEVRIQLERQPVARGQVVDRVTGAPVTKFSIILSRSEYLVFAGHRVTQRFEDPEGRFEYSDLQGNGDFYLFAQAPGYAGGRSESIKIVPGQDVDGVVIPVHKGAKAAGRVVDSSGQPIAGASVQLVPQNQVDGQAAVFLAMLQKNMATASKSTRSGSDGTFEFENVLEGNYKVKANHKTFAESESKDATFVPPDGEVTLGDTILMRGGTVFGVVRDDDGNPEEGSRVQITEKGMFGGNNYSAVSKTDGTFRIEHVRPGIYQAHVAERAGQASFDLFEKLLNNQSRPEIIVGDGDSVEVVLD